MHSLWLIFQLLLCLFIGYAFAHRFPLWLMQGALKVLPYFSYLLLIAIACEFAETLHTIANPQLILSNALILAGLTSFGAFGCCYVFFKYAGYQTTQGKVSFDLLLKSFINISYAFLALSFGYVLSELINYFAIPYAISTWHLLLVFMFLIGLDLSFSPIERSWMNWKIVLVPLGCILGSIIGALIAYVFIENISLKDLIMLSQGYGFYSMSGIVVSELKTPELGSVALLNDLFREIYAIILMYSLGWRYPRSAIASAGATAMDVTLPMVKQACGNEFIPHAMVSGFILTLLAPILVSVLAAL
ncbi:lysine exporter LysO family protein [Acinetobacter shaoyimingii]|uniref:Lysine exporter LysO family protein n=1 Tax=Acinetobacter shaoyimingii TaxID=2715164 RepID=A0A6G8RUS8_9GAMM|nr:lysine exporter LysO family protein [Acinetobacter shaoyimingii]QIO05686.1 lysine exporter LysO family protein [Acinetobacter shaoyimingii]